MFKILFLFLPLVLPIANCHAQTQRFFTDTLASEVNLYAQALKVIPGGAHARYIVSSDSRLERILGKRPRINGKRYTIVSPYEGDKLSAKHRFKALKISPIRWDKSSFILEIKAIEIFREHTSDKTSYIIHEITEHRWTYHYQYRCEEDGFQPIGVEWDGKYVMGLVE